MENISINTYPKVEQTKRTVHIATSFDSVPIIVFGRIPRSLRGFVQYWAEEIITHETVHIVLHGIGEAKACHRLDRVFPYVTSIRNFLNKKKKEVEKK